MTIDAEKSKVTRCFLYTSVNHSIVAFNFNFVEPMVGTPTVVSDCYLCFTFLDNLFLKPLSLSQSGCLECYKSEKLNAGIGLLTAC